MNMLGLAESWRVWTDIMTPFCDKYRAIAVDIEGMGQSPWPSIETDLPSGGDAREFMGDMELQLLEELGLTRFNLVVTDYGFWSTLSMLSKKDKKNKSKVLRYLKLQSTVGVEVSVLPLFTICRYTVI
jgi:pimeloyl-ACP methyl ester carboxylesterase